MSTLPPAPAGATAASVSRAKFGRPTTVKTYDYVVGVTVVKIATNNPKRLQLVLTNWGQGVVAFGTTIALTPTTGNPLSANGGNAIILVSEDGEPVAWDYYAISLTAGNAVHVEETEAV